MSAGPASSSLAKPLGLYAAGHVALLAGAWSTHVTGSMWPMAFAASTCLMLTLPVLRHVIDRAAARRNAGPSRRV